VARAHFLWETLGSNSPSTLLVGSSSSQHCCLRLEKGDGWNCLEEFLNELFEIVINLFKNLFHLLHLCAKFLDITLRDRRRGKVDLLSELGQLGLTLLVHPPICSGAVEPSKLCQV
jgi:hypothetical protein